MSNSNPQRVFDPGLQPERTALAWQRTSLALSAGSVALGRLLLPRLGISSYLISAIGIALCLWLWLWLHARQRYLKVNKTLLSVPSQALPSFGGLALLCALFCLFCGIASLIFVMTHF